MLLHAAGVLRQLCAGPGATSCRRLATCGRRWYLRKSSCSRRAGCLRCAPGGSFRCCGGCSAGRHTCGSCSAASTSISLKRCGHGTAAHAISSSMSAAQHYLEGIRASTPPASGCKHALPASFAPTTLTLTATQLSTSRRSALCVHVTSHVTSHRYHRTMRSQAASCGAPAHAQRGGISQTAVVGVPSDCRREMRSRATY